MDNLENALAKITGTTECMREDLRQHLNCTEMRAVQQTYLKTLEDVKELLTKFILKDKKPEAN